MSTHFFDFVAVETLNDADLLPSVKVFKANVVRSEDLFAQSNVVEILHGGEVYLLTRTRQNKLLLTKQGGR